MNIQRRSFLTGSALLATSAVLPKVSEAKVQGVVEAKNKSIELPPSNGGRASEKAKKLVLGEPFLQAPGTTSMGIALKHESGSRAMLADGAVAAAKFMVGKEKGMYDMESILNAQ